MSAPTQWFYRKEGVIDDSTIGPVSEDDIAALIRKRTIKPSTLLASPTVTQGQWFRLSDLDFNEPLARYDARVELQREREAQARQAARSKHEQEAREQQQLELAARQLQAQEQAVAREAYLQAIRDQQKRYRIIVTDVEQSEQVCNRMGIEGWELESAFAETFTYPQCGGCCQPDIRRQFVFVFSQPLNVGA
jgi:hypothetical protein